MTVLRIGNDTVAFMVELAALASLAVAAWSLGPNLVARIGLGLAAVAVFVAVWGTWLAPRAGHRLDMPWLLLVKVAVFAVSFAALALAGHPVLAAVCGGLTVAHLAVATANGWL